MKGVNVLSLFDGGSMGQQALKELGVPIDKYFASEIDKHAIKVAMNNHPETIQLGDVCGVQYENGALFHNQNNDPLKNGGSYITDIDLLTGGSPCQGFSFSGKQLNFNDPRSKLFFEFVRLLKECKPKYWLLENVVMKQEYQDVISGHLGVKPVKLNSALTSAQNRVRLYWANFEIIEPTDQGIKLEDILEDTEMIGPSAIRGKKLNKASIIGRRLNKRGVRDDYNKEIPITQCLEVRDANDSDRTKSNCLTTVAKDTVLTSLPFGRHIEAFEMKDKWRNYTKVERCRLMNLPDNYCDSVSLNQAVKITGNGWDVGMLKHIFNQLKNEL